MAKQNNRRRTAPSRKSKKKTSVLRKKAIQFLTVALLLLLGFGIIYHYRNGLAYYFSFKTNKTLDKEAKEKRLSDVRNYQVLEKNESKAIGIDVSEYQDEIDWDEVKTLDDDYQLSFVFIRATVGNDRLDKRFEENWLQAKENKLIRGAYHYYRPNENSLEQAELFIKTVRLEKGDLPPVLDIERLPENQSMERLKLGLRRWLTKIEAHYKVKPIIYTGERYYDDFLKKEFSDYLFWIANYNFYREKMEEDWLFWQFTEKASVSGIKGNVDVNIFNGDLEQLQFITKE
ncbi:glycoside hydrolase [Flavobacterium sp. L1I52]|uniref:Glycoside hydrolase n=1 Tax=Flavobacterium pokkalii TaxID=1940408 RepID=A0ABR7UXG6_9FLAO|nr:glycoside hydrolase family 25 protein [Flavobacterium pokkalii]MBD0726458.1 glycoside hydrolase [Flavobacterium pokkalii]